jgi:hypothetical protein
MKDVNALRLKNGMNGAGMSLFFCAIAYLLSAVIFSEMKDPTAALLSMTALSAISAGVYLLLEATVFIKGGSSAFAIGYFGTLALVSALVFFITSIVPLTYVFDYAGTVNSLYLRHGCIRLCSCNAFALVLRLGYETFVYLKGVLHGDT